MIDYNLKEIIRLKNIISYNFETISFYKKYKIAMEGKPLYQKQEINYKISILISQIEQTRKELILLEGFERNRHNRGKSKVIYNHEPFTKVMCYGKFLDLVTDREEIERLSEIECERIIEK